MNRKQQKSGNGEIGKSDRGRKEKEREGNLIEKCTKTISFILNFVRYGKDGE